MKKLLALVLSAVMLLSFIPVLSAEADEEPATVTVYIEDIDMALELPEELIILTRNEEETSELSEMLGYPFEDLLELFEASFIYVNAIPETSEYEIIVTMIPLEGTGNLRDTSKLERIAAEFSINSEFENAGIDLIDCEIYENDNEVFYRMHISQEINCMTVYGLQYYTINNNMAINLTLHSYFGEITEDHEELMQVIADSVVFNPEL